LLIPLSLSVCARCAPTAHYVQC